MFKARAFAVQKPRLEEWLSETGYACRDLPQFSAGSVKRYKPKCHKKSRELWQQLGFAGYHYERPDDYAFIEFLEESLGEVLEYDPDDVKYSEETDSRGRPVFPELRNLLLWLLEQRPSGIRALLDAGMIHVGGDLFPLCYYMDGMYTPSLPTSLLGMATIELCSPAATELVLSMGASPDDV